MATYRLAFFCILGFGWLLNGCGGGGTEQDPDNGGDGSIMLAPPDQLTVDGGRERVIVSWLSVPEADSYNIYYETAPGVTRSTGTRISGFGSPHTIRGLSNGTRYYVVVTAENQSGESVESREKSAVAMDPAPPRAPINVKAEASVDKIIFSWDDAEGATAYHLYYATIDRVTKESGTKVSDVTSPFELVSLTSGTPYYAVLTAVGVAGESAESFEVSAVPTSAPPPSAPLDVRARLLSEDPGTVLLSWAASPGANEYALYYAEASGVTKKSTRVANVSSPLALTNLKLNQAYFFAVAASNAGGEGALSLQASATPRTDVLPEPKDRMALIPARTYLFGDGRDSIAYAKPVRSVYVSSFWIDRYETTYDLWRKVFDWALRHEYAFDNLGRNGFDGLGTDQPVSEVNWYDVVKWLNARSEMEGLRPVYYTDATLSSVYRSGRLELANEVVDWTADGYRLPTEAEWEMAARGGLEGARYPWGDEPADPSLVPGHLANYKVGRSTSVGIYPPNGFGLYDMAGNVWEWTWNWWTPDYSDPTLTWVDPRGPNVAVSAEENLRVRRGGGFAYGPAYLRNAERVPRTPDYRAAYFGFRSARSVVAE